MTAVARAFDRLLPIIEVDLQLALNPIDSFPSLYFEMLHYHMGWINADGTALPDRKGGKRIRPLMCLLVCESVCGEADPARPAAAAIELIHNFSLLHDDIQDGSPLRRGTAAVWKVWGEAQAINAGDAMFTLAHLAIPRLAKGRLPAEMIVRLIEILDETNLDLTRGQYLDMSFETRSDVTADAYLDMIGGKTAALLAAATQMGAITGRAEQERQALFHRFGQQVGLAFQVQDDILDIWGDSALTGKQAAIDIYQRKKSLPVLYGLERSAELQDLYRDDEPFDDSTVDHIKGELENLGALDYAKQLVQTYSGEAVASLEAAGPQGEAGEALMELVNMLLKRQA